MMDEHRRDQTAERAPEPDDDTLDVSDAETGRQILIPQFRLRVIGRDAHDLTFSSEGERATIGKDRSCDLVLDDPTVSRFHCEIRAEDTRFVVRDLNSRNGTIVDGTAVLVAYLHQGATLYLGKSAVRFEPGEDQVSIPLSPARRFGSMVGHSSAMRAVFAALERLSKSDATLLLSGETGTGKDLAAEAVHSRSHRRDAPFVVVDCGAVPANLMESELFGHERGAFTGALRDRQGAFEQANGGTVFLDEIGELSLELQPKLLRVLEKREIQRVGGSKRIPVDIRVIAATNRNLKKEINARAFRSDLYYRLAVAEVELPPLRKRREDIPDIVDAMLAHVSTRDSDFAADLQSQAFFEQLESHAWPGNVRELRNHVERCLLFGTRAPENEDASSASSSSDPLTIDVHEPLAIARQHWLTVFERRYLEKLLTETNNNVSEAARRADVNRAHFYRLLSKCGLK